ncbi:MAG: phage late control D family protein [Deltaproteobacteria bacterium]
MNRDAPLFVVKVAPEGEDAQRLDLSERVLSFEYEDSDTKVDRLVLTLDNFDLAAFDEPWTRKGNLLDVAWGYPGNLAPTREVVIQKVTGFQVLSVEGHGRAMLLHRVVKSRVFENLTRSEVAQQVAKENGYDAAHQEIAETEERIAVLSQARESDAQLLARLARKEGFAFYVDGAALHWHPRRLGQAPIKTFRWYSDPNAGEVLSVHVENDLSGKPGAVRLKGRDPLQKQDIDVQGSNAKTKRDVLAPVVELVDPELGKSHLEARAASEETRPTAAPTDGLAKRQADADYVDTQRTTVELTLTVVGDPDLVAKSVIELQGLGQRLSGKYFVKEARHQLGSSGYTVALRLFRDGHGETGVTSKGRLNQTKAADSDPAALQQVETVDPETGATRVTYRDSRGREKGS